MTHCQHDRDGEHPEARATSKRKRGVRRSGGEIQAETGSTHERGRRPCGAPARLQSGKDCLSAGPGWSVTARVRWLQVPSQPGLRAHLGSWGSVGVGGLGRGGVEGRDCETEQKKKGRRGDGEGMVL